MALKEEVEIRRKDGSVFVLTSKRGKTRSPFDVPGLTTAATTDDIIDAVRASRQRC